jgi:hypothetical protein
MQSAASERMRVAQSQDSLLDSRIASERIGNAEGESAGACFSKWTSSGDLPVNVWMVRISDRAACGVEGQSLGEVLDSGQPQRATVEYYIPTSQARGIADPHGPLVDDRASLIIAGRWRGNERQRAGARFR